MKRAGIDWEQAKSRLRASEVSLKQALEESPERIEAAYRRRALRLADEKTAQADAAAGLPVLIFRLAGERYAIELKELADVVPFAGCFPVPGAPPRFLGLIDLRGELRPVLDLLRLLALSKNGEPDCGFVLLLRGRGRRIGLKVDHLEGLREIRPEELSAPGRLDCVKGVMPDALMLIDLEAVLAQVFPKEESLPI